MKRTKWTIVVLVIGCFLTGCAEMNQTTMASSSPVMDRIAARGELRVGISGDMPPMNLLTKDDKIIGMDADVAAMVAEAMGARLNLQRIEFNGLLPALESGRILSGEALRKAQVIEVGRLRLGGLSAVPDAPSGHVSIRPGVELTPEVQQAIRDWAATRPAALGLPLRTRRGRL